MFRASTVAEADLTPPAAWRPSAAGFPGTPLAAGFVRVTRFLAKEAAGRVMDAAADSCRYKMKEDFQLCRHQLSSSQRGAMVVYSAVNVTATPRY